MEHDANCREGQSRSVKSNNTKKDDDGVSAGSGGSTSSTSILNNNNNNNNNNKSFPPPAVATRGHLIADQQQDEQQGREEHRLEPPPQSTTMLAKKTADSSIAASRRGRMPQEEKRKRPRKPASSCKEEQSGGGGGGGEPPTENSFLPEDFKPSLDDIMCGRGKGSWQHEGNQRFLEVIRANIWRYDEQKNRSEKGLIVTSIVVALREAGSRFIKFDSESKRWYDIGDANASRKCGHAVRDMLTIEKAAGVQNQKSRRVNKKMSGQQLLTSKSNKSSSDEEQQGSYYRRDAFESGETLSIIEPPTNADDDFFLPFVSWAGAGFLTASRSKKKVMAKDDIPLDPPVSSSNDAEVLQQHQLPPALLENFHGKRRRILEQEEGGNHYRQPASFHAGEKDNQQSSRIIQPHPFATGFLPPRGTRRGTTISTAGATTVLVLAPGANQDNKEQPPVPHDPHLDLLAFALDDHSEDHDLLVPTAESAFAAEAEDEEERNNASSETSDEQRKRTSILSHDSNILPPDWM